ncbi:MAG TPA: hypothetical protein VFB62_10300 [Polyangiaceae bacterium]|nr:hypothetical protein [Polyangiaceae bacterium]
MADQEDKEQADGTPERPSETFKQGISLLWRAARSAADEIKREVEKGGVTDALRQAGRDLENAASQAARTLEGFIERVGPGDPKTSAWPNTGEVPKAKQADADIPEDGGTDDKGEKRDMRIHLDDD